MVILAPLALPMVMILHAKPSGCLAVDLLLRYLRQPLETRHRILFRKPPTAFCWQRSYMRLLNALALCSLLLCDGKVLDGILAALLETAKVVAAEQMRSDESKIALNIDGRKDVEELMAKNAHRVPVQSPPGLSIRGRSGQGDSVGEASFSCLGQHDCHLAMVARYSTVDAARVLSSLAARY